MPDLLLLGLNVAWAVLTLAFLAGAGKVYLHREEIPEPVLQRTLPRLSIIIPARDEAVNIGDCLECITRLDYPEGALEVIVIDDHSSDGTAAIVDEHAVRDDRIRLLRSKPLPAGWMGKSHACWQGAAAARGKWLLFIDADTYLKPLAARAALAHALDGGREFLSIIPFQRIVSVQERVAMPGVFLRFAAATDFRRVNDPDDDFALANGQFLLFRRDAYDRIGGHEAIRGEVSDDLVFAHRVKRYRIPACTLFGERQVETRMYRSLAEVWNGFSKNALEIMHITSAGKMLSESAVSFGLAAGFLLPIVLACSQEAAGSALWQAAAGISSATLFTLLVFFALSLRALRIPIGYALAAPFGLALHGAIIVNSWIRKRTGTRKWKGRHY